MHLGWGQVGYMAEKKRRRKVALYCVEITFAKRIFVVKKKNYYFNVIPYFTDVREYNERIFRKKQSLCLIIRAQGTFFLKSVTLIISKFVEKFESRKITMTILFVLLACMNPSVTQVAMLRG